MISCASTNEIYSPKSLHFKSLIMKNILWIYYILANVGAIGCLYLNQISHNYLVEISFVLLLCTSFWVYPLTTQASTSLRSTITLIFLFFVIRILAIHAPSFYENDYYRYLVEARMLDHKLDPYLVSPWDLQSIIKKQSLVLPQEQRDNLYNLAENAGFGWLTAIYPPIIIHAFRWADSISQLGYLFLFSEIFIIVYLLLSSKSFHVSLWRWWLNPLIIVEVYINKHYDIWIGLAVLIAVCSLKMRKPLLTSLAVSLAVHLKGFAIIFVPYFKRNIVLGFTCFYVILELLSAHYYPNRLVPDNSLTIFASQWEFNNGLFTWTRIFVETLDWTQYPNLLVRYTFMSCLLLVMVYVYLRPNKQSVFVRLSLFFYLLSPVTNPWYFIMSVPFFLMYANDRRELQFFSLCPVYYLLWLAPDPINALVYTTPIQLSIIIYILIILPKKPDYGSCNFRLQKN